MKESIKTLEDMKSENEELIKHLDIVEPESKIIDKLAKQNQALDKAIYTMKTANSLARAFYVIRNSISLLSYPTDIATAKRLCANLEQIFSATHNLPEKQVEVDND